VKDQDGADAKKSALVKQVCDALKVHAEIEEEIFYPAVRKAIDDAKVTVLGEKIEHQVKEEEGDMFVKAKGAKVDVVTLGASMAKRKAELAAAAQSGTEGSKARSSHKKA